MGYSRAEMVAWAKATPALKLYDNLKYQMTDEKNSEWFDGEKYIELHKFL